MEAAAELAEFRAASCASHEQNLLLPWVRLDRVARTRPRQGFATPNIGLLTDMIACPGGDDLLAGQRALSDSPPRSPSASPTSTKPGHRRDRPAHQWLHQLLRPPPQRYIGILAWIKMARSGTRSRWRR